MKKETFKISAIFLAILMCFSVISISASAETPVSTRSKGSFGFQVRYFDGYSSGEQIAGWMSAGKITDGSGSFKIATNSGASYFSGYGMKETFALLEGYNFQQLTVEGGAFPLITTGADNTARYLSIRYMILSSKATEVGFTYQYKIGGDSVKTPFEAVKVGKWSVICPGAGGQMVYRTDGARNSGIGEAGIHRFRICTACCRSTRTVCSVYRIYGRHCRLTRGGKKNEASKKIPGAAGNDTAAVRGGHSDAVGSERIPRRIGLLERQAGNHLKTKRRT